MLVEATVFAAYRLPVQHGSDLSRFLFVRKFDPAVLVFHPLVPAHFAAALRDGGILGREVNAADLGVLLQKMPNLRGA